VRLVEDHEIDRRRVLLEQADRPQVDAEAEPLVLLARLPEQVAARGHQADADRAAALERPRHRERDERLAASRRDHDEGAGQHLRAGIGPHPADRRLERLHDVACEVDLVRTAAERGRLRGGVRRERLAGLSDRVELRCCCGGGGCCGAWHVVNHGCRRLTDPDQRACSEAFAASSSPPMGSVDISHPGR
jgi:hypothetical protein